MTEFSTNDDERDALGPDGIAPDDERTDEQAAEPIEMPPTLEADEADVLEQHQEVPLDDERRS